VVKVDGVANDQLGVTVALRTLARVTHPKVYPIQNNLTQPITLYAMGCKATKHTLQAEWLLSDDA